jgi:hypothetical protein
MFRRISEILRAASEGWDFDDCRSTFGIFCESRDSLWARGRRGFHSLQRAIRNRVQKVTPPTQSIVITEGMNIFDLGPIPRYISESLQRLNTKDRKV